MNKPAAGPWSMQWTGDNFEKFEELQGYGLNGETFLTIEVNEGGQLEIYTRDILLDTVSIGEWISNWGQYASDGYPHFKYISPNPYPSLLQEIPNIDVSYKYVIEEDNE